MSKTIYIGGRLESKEKGNVVTGANAILDDTKGKKQNVINKETDDELARLEQSKQDNLNFDNTPTENSTNPVTSGGVYTAEKALSDAIEAILLLIPSAATALNKLVDTNTMNSSISTATATFRGTYNAVSDLGLTYQATHAQIEAALDALGLTADNNDFAFVQIPVSDQSQDIAKTERFKFNGTNWLYEYDLNTSGFTAAQWAAINSGITVALVTKLTDLPTAAALQLALNAKQDTLTFDNEPTALSQNPVYSGGIYKAIQAVATALSDYSTTTDGRLNVLEGLVPTEASSSNKLTDKAYVDGLIQAITELIPAEATSANQLADKAYALEQILAATPAFKGQFTTLAELQAVASPKAGDLGIVRTKDSDGMDVFTVYQYLNNAWNVFYSLSYHPQTKPATTGTTGDYPYNGMGRVELAMNMVNTGTDLEPVMVNQLTQDMFYKGAVGSRVPNTNTIFVIRYDYVLAENITIPDNCVLEFEGGSISGAYTLTGANTDIKAGLVKIFDTTTILAGTWNVSEAYPQWFGAVCNDNTVDNSVYINKLASSGLPIHIPKGHYYYNSPIVIIGVHSFVNEGDLEYLNNTPEQAFITFVQCYTGIFKIDGRVYTDSIFNFSTANNSKVVALRFINCDDLQVHVNSISCFNIGIQLIGDGEGCCYNTFYLGKIDNTNRGIDITWGLTSPYVGWANENTFIGGSIKVYTPFMNAGYDAYGVYVKKGDNAGYNGIDALRVKNVNMEGLGAAGGHKYPIHLGTKGLDCVFEDIRTEGCMGIIEAAVESHNIKHSAVAGPNNIAELPNSEYYPNASTLDSFREMTPIKELENSTPTTIRVSTYDYIAILGQTNGRRYSVTFTKRLVNGVETAITNDEIYTLYKDQANAYQQSAGNTGLSLNGWTSGETLETNFIKIPKDVTEAEVIIFGGNDPTLTAKVLGLKYNYHYRNWNFPSE